MKDEKEERRLRRIEALKRFYESENISPATKELSNEFDNNKNIGFNIIVDPEASERYKSYQVMTDE